MLLQAACTFPSTRSRVDQSRNSVLKTKLASGLLSADVGSDFARDGVPQRIKAPTLLMTADRGQAQSVEKARQYQTLIPNSQLVVVRSDAYHIAAANADECVANVLAFIKEARRKG